jgi:hypothetical protein
VCDASPRNYVMSLVPTFEETGSALDNFKVVVGCKQAIRTDETNQHVEETVPRSPGKSRFHTEHIVQFLGVSETLKSCL